MTLGIQIPWRPLMPQTFPHHVIEARIDKICADWEGTPYRDGHMIPHVGVDCIRLCAAFGSEIERRELMVRPDRLPRDAAFHQRDTALAAIRALMSNFPLWRPVSEPQYLEPGDLIVVGPPGVPAHGMIVTARPNCLLHASKRAVEYAGLAMDPAHMTIQHIYRSTEREGWAGV